MGIKPEGAWFADDHGNKWDMDKFHKEDAERLAMTLNNCTGCINCSYCENCADCTNCRHCENCRDCTNCRYCDDCIDCDKCEHCRRCEESHNSDYSTSCIRCAFVTFSSALSDCRKCRSCDHCTECYDCEFCSYCGRCTQCESCKDCIDFRTNPERVVGPYIADIRGNISVYWLGYEREQVAGGPGTGSVMDLRCSVAGMNSKLVSKEYTKFLDALHEYKSSLGK